MAAIAISSLPFRHKQVLNLHCHLLIPFFTLFNQNCFGATLVATVQKFFRASTSRYAGCRFKSVMDWSIPSSNFQIDV